MRIMEILEKKCSAKSFRAHRYSLDDQSSNSVEYEAKREVTKNIAETNPPEGAKCLKQLSEKVVLGGSRLSYFLDGSRRVYKVDDLVFTSGGVKSIYPVVAGQVAVACCKRRDGKLTLEEFIEEKDIAIPDIANADRTKGFFDGLALELQNSRYINGLPISFNNVLVYKTARVGDEKYEDKGVAKIQEKMIEKEKELVARLVSKERINDDNYLVKDGSLEYRLTNERKTEHQLELFRKNYKFVIGVSKRFNPELYLGKNNKPNPGFIAELQCYHRTPVVLSQHEGINFGVWYIRIRGAEKTRSPFDGVIKVEKMLVTDEELSTLCLNSEEVDNLTAHLINERNPVCYGSDERWGNHIYPIYLTESYIKQKYMSTESFLQLF